MKYDIFFVVCLRKSAGRLIKAVRGQRPGVRAAQSPEYPRSATKSSVARSATQGSGLPVGKADRLHVGAIIIRWFDHYLPIRLSFADMILVVDAIIVCRYDCHLLMRSLFADAIYCLSVRSLLDDANIKYLCYAIVHCWICTENW